MDRFKTPPHVGSVGVDGAGELGVLNKNYSISPASEAKNTFSHCDICGGRFVPNRVNHTICDECLSYPQVGRTVSSIQRLMAEVFA